MNCNWLNIYTINAIFDEVKFTGIVRVVYILIESSFNISDCFSSFFGGRSEVCFGSFINGKLQEHILPTTIIWINLFEDMARHLFKEIRGVELPKLQQMTWHEAMKRFGSDKPDLRFGMELVDVSETVKDTEFVVFKGALENGGSVRGINAKGQGAMPRKKIDKLVEFAKGYGAKGLAYIAIHEDGSWKEMDDTLEEVAFGRSIGGTDQFGGNIETTE